MCEVEKSSYISLENGILLLIKQKLKEGMYTDSKSSLEDMRNDFKRIIRNAMKFYGPASSMHASAGTLMNSTLQTINHFVEEYKRKEIWFLLIIFV